MFKTKEIIKQELILSVRTGMGANDITPGSVLDVLLDAVAEQQYEQVYDIYSLSQSRKLENMSSEQLNLEGRKLGLIRQGAKKAAGRVLIYFDHGFEIVEKTEKVDGGSGTKIATKVLKLNKVQGLHPFQTNGQPESDSLVIMNKKKLLEGTPQTMLIDSINDKTFKVTFTEPVEQVYEKGTKLLVVCGIGDNQNGYYKSIEEGNHVDPVIKVDTIISSGSTGTTESLNFKLLQPVELSKSRYYAVVSLKAEESGIDYNVKADTVFTLKREGVKLRIVAINDFVGGEIAESDGSFIQRIKSHYDSLSGGTARGILNVLNDLESKDKNRVLSTKLSHTTDGGLNVYVNQLTNKPLIVTEETQTIKTIKEGPNTIQLDLKGRSMLPPGKIVTHIKKLIPKTRWKNERIPEYNPQHLIVSSEDKLQAIKDNTTDNYFAKEIKIGSASTKVYKYLKNKDKRTKFNNDGGGRVIKINDAKNVGINISKFSFRTRRSLGQEEVTTMKVNHDNGLISIENNLGYDVNNIDIVYHLIHTDELYTEVHKNLYGDVKDLDTYPGILALGSNADIHAAVDKNIALSVKIGLLDGFSELDINTVVRSDVSSFVNSLKIGESLVMSQLEARILSIPGIHDIKVVQTDDDDSIDNIEAKEYEVIKIDDESIEIQGI